MPVFDNLWSELAPIGRHAATGGYRRFAWTSEDAVLREWFASHAAARGLDLTLDRAGNQWAWWGDPDAAVAAGDPGVVIGSHLDSVPDGGAFDGPLGVVSAFAAVDALRADGFTPARPVGVVNFGDEEGARFGVACAGSRIICGALAGERARGLRDGAGVTMAEAMQHSGFAPSSIGPDAETLARIGTFVELHVEQGRALVDLDAPVGLASSIWPHGRWRLDLLGEANHAGTTRLVDRRDPMLNLAAVIQAARSAAERYGAVATVGKVRVEPNGVNAIASAVTAWLDARGPHEDDVRRIAEVVAAAGGVAAIEESFTGDTGFDAPLRDRLSGALGSQLPVLATGAGHDAGILASAGIPTAMLFVRNPTGVSHSPAEYAELDDCHAGVAALTGAVRELAS
ncbi:N-carbamoyl-L-amino-acid hydrolase [Jatrophihabitans sp. GAS493]|uniref:allantoate amidohydrolase n=1 Tax=Jatrophihabitans sp. GAS493 TaxID=1907575 RepID=UPI000BB8F7F9|nr:allantoate amidohydrolase [Jatrophihabitans sp. GAS493]SOD70852.1 N-carbamoyl-L-amino-acid hydrolase [Jatrophihabitans sp. GAS493]